MPRGGLARHGHCAGRTRSKEAEAWSQIKARCYNPNNIAYARYGARGIGMSAYLRDSFEAFLAEVGPAPGLEYSIDRINPEGNYEPGNIRWATRAQQQHNRRDNKLTLEKVSEIDALVLDGINQADIARRFGVHPCTISRVLARKRWKER